MRYAISADLPWSAQKPSKAKAGAMGYVNNITVPWLAPLLLGDNRDMLDSVDLPWHTPIVIGAYHEICR